MSEITETEDFKEYAPEERKAFRQAIGNIQLIGIAKNVLRTHWQKQYRQPAVSLEEAPEPEVASVEEAALSEAGTVSILSAIHKAPEPGREVLYLRLLGNLSFRQIGDVLGQTETWARVTFYRAKQAIVKELKEHESNFL